MTPIRILISMVLFVVGINVSAQQISSTLPMGINRYPMDTTVAFSLGVVSWSLDTETLLYGEFIPYRATSEKDLVSFIEKTLQSLSFDEGDMKGLEGFPWFSVRAGYASYDNIIGDFALERTPSGWKVPQLNIELEYRSAQTFDFPGATDFIVETEDGRIFSTIGFGKNDFGTGCSIAVSQSALAEGKVDIGGGVFSAKSPIRYLKIFQDNRYEIRDGNGYRTEVSSPAPSWISPSPQPERRPLMVNIHLEGKGRLPVLVVSGDGSESAFIEQSRDGGRNWGPAISLSQPPRLSSLNGGEYLYEFAEDQLSTGDTVVFYRARATSETQNN